MKTLKKWSILSLMLVVLSSFSLKVNAQPEGKGDGKKMEMHKCGIPNLSDDQKAQIEKLKVPFQKEMTALRNQMGEKKAHLKTVSETDKPDMAEINKTIDDITLLMNKMMKLKATHHQDVRKLLTDEQKVAFDNHKGPHGCMRKHAGRRGQEGPPCQPDGH